MKRRRHSLAGKLLALFIVMAVLFVVLVGASMKLVFRSHFETNVRPHLVQYLEYVQRDIGLPADRARAAALAPRSWARRIPKSTKGARKQLTSRRKSR